jgi:serine/threonine protein kinase
MCRATGRGISISFRPRSAAVAAAGASKQTRQAETKQRRRTDSTASTSSSCSSSSSSPAITPTRPQNFDLCPVTGIHANILDEYFILPVILGTGNYGTVRECIHKQSRRSYAVKSIEKAKIGNLEHLRREVQLLQSMKHENVMSLKDCYEDRDFVHIVTEKLTGGELFDKIIDNTTDDGCFSERKAVKVIKSLLEAVSYLHDNGIVHRDIKPENILFTSNDEDVKLIDFGLSRRHQQGIDKPMTNPVGTAYYMSPELLSCQYDQATDIWSVGVIAYTLLTGYPPFNGDTDRDIFIAIKRQPLEFWGHMWKGIGNDAMNFIECLLKKDAKERFTAEEALMHPWLNKFD